MAVQLQRHLFTVDEYHRMAQAGIFAEDDRVELIDGEIVQMAPIGNRHAACVRRLNRLFSRLVGEQAIVDVQNPVRVGEQSEPQPDVVLLRPRPDLYGGFHPGVEDVLLIVEVAETSADYDRGVKVPLYARFGIPEVWLVDLGGDAMEVYRTPSAEGYQTRQALRRGERLTPLALPNLDLAVNDILG
jgi:Uma2 family endonuclease